MSSSAARYFPGVFARRNGNGAHEQTSEALVDGSEACTEKPERAEADVSDEALMLRIQEVKDMAALGVLYRRYAKIVYSVCARIIRDPHEAEDLVHEVFLSLYKRCGSFDAKKGTARSWLLQLTYHKCFDWRDYLRARHGFRQGNGEGKSPAAPSELMEEQGPIEQAPKGNLMYLATPAALTGGWQPGQWTTPAQPVAAAINRYQLIGGWSLRPGDSGGENKSIRRCVPAGSVYFFDTSVTVTQPMTEYGWQIGYGIAYAGER